MNQKIKSITKGSEIIDKIFNEIVLMLRQRKNPTELEVVQEIKKLAKKFGADGMAWNSPSPALVGFGSGAADIHHKASTKKIGNNNFLMLDYGVKVKGFCSDFTRTIFIGTPTKLHEGIYNFVFYSHKAATEKIFIGQSGDVIDFTARHIINQSGFGKTFAHTTGHGVGKKIHEAPSIGPSSKDILKKDDVITIEPGIYLPKKFGVRIEDMILVTDKPKVFSKIPKDFKSMIIKRI
ncbi:MAG: M24 family metallopeptidase [Candidatus Doudnabacteria bacterium]|nr:M24 family metallopeptidase [Candidatus Doudnabacteria bacterium]